MGFWRETGPMGEPYLVNLNILRYLQALKKSGARTSLMQRFKFQSREKSAA